MGGAGAEMNKAIKILNEAEDLNKQIENCRDDKTAVLLQEKLVNLLLENFQDEQFLEGVAILKQELEKSRNKS